MILTLVALKLPTTPDSRCARNSGICSRPWWRSHHSAPTTLAVSRPAAASERYAACVPGVTQASCQPVIPSECRCSCAFRIAASHSAGRAAARSCR